MLSAPEMRLNNAADGTGSLPNFSGLHHSASRCLKAMTVAWLVRSRHLNSIVLLKQQFA